MLSIENLEKSGNIKSKAEMTHNPEKKALMVFALGLLLCIFTFLS